LSFPQRLNNTSHIFVCDAFISIEAPIRRAAYSDRTAWIMFQCSKAAYLEDPNVLREALAEGSFRLIKTFLG
jgi:hypothetical protein